VRHARERCLNDHRQEAGTCALDVGLRTACRPGRVAVARGRSRGLGSCVTCARPSEARPAGRRVRDGRTA